MGGGPTTTSSSQIPGWVEAAGKQVYGQAQDFYNKQSTTPPPGVQVAGFTPQQNSAFSQLSSYHPTDVTGSAMDLIGRATNPISAPTAIDQNSFLGSIQSWMDPYISGAINPAVDAINRQGAINAKGIDSQAIGAHAFGDARNGVMQSENQRNTQKAVGDTVGSMMTGAYGQAMAGRQTAIGDYLNTALGNRTADLSGANAMVSTAASQQNSFLALMQSLLGAGGAQQAQNQHQLDVPLQNWQNQTQSMYDALSSLVSTMGQLPYPRSTTTSTNDGGAGIMGGIGSMIGALGPLIMMM